MTYLIFIIIIIILDLLCMSAERCCAIGVHKAFMKVRGLDVGPPRAPNVAMDDNTFAAFTKDLQDVGFFDWCQ